MQEILEGADEKEHEVAKQVVQEILTEPELPLTSPIYSHPKAGTGKWASLIRIIHPITGETSWIKELPQNEAAFSICVTKFTGKPDDDHYVIVGTAIGLQLSPRQVGDGGRLRTYKFSKDARELELLHVTNIDEVPHAMCAFQGRLLIGVGRFLRIYDLGKKKLLRKCESKVRAWDQNKIYVDA